jgi:secondary thiamine-phosphate synthase enzyme
MIHFDEILSVQTHRRNEMVDITAEVAATVAKCSVDTGTATVFCPHTTAGITINENADPDVPHDILSRNIEPVIDTMRATATPTSNPLLSERVKPFSFRTGN